MFSVLSDSGSVNFDRFVIIIQYIFVSSRVEIWRQVALVCFGLQMCGLLLCKGVLVLLHLWSTTVEF